MVGMANVIRSCPGFPSERGDAPGFCYAIVLIHGYYPGSTTSNGPTSSRARLNNWGSNFRKPLQPKFGSGDAWLLGSDVAHFCSRDLGSVMSGCWGPKCCEPL